MGIASNAVLARVRTMYGKRLRENDYSNLIACQGNADIANYLKTRTSYGDIFTSTTSVNDITAEVIEFTLNKNLSLKLEKLCAFEKTINDSFYQLYVIKSDIKIITSAAKNIVSPLGRASTYMPGEFFKKRSYLNIETLYNSSSPRELVEALEHTRYHNVAKKFISSDGEFVFSNIEVYLYDYYATAAKEICSNFSSKSKKELDELIDLEIDTFNVCYIYRQQKIGTSNELIFENIIKNHGTVSPNKLKAIIEAGSDIAFMSLVGKTKIGKNFTNDDLQYIEGAFERNVYKINKHFLRFSTNPNISVITYINLCSTEVSNITHIVEGKRYNLPNDEIQKYLVGVE